MSSTTKLKRAGTPLILDGKFFKISESSECDGKVTAQCVQCSITSSKSGKIKGKMTTTSNFITHLQRIHGKDGIFEEYQQCSKRSDDTKQQKKLTDSFPIQLKPNIKTKAESLLVDYVVETMSPLARVDNPAFGRLLKEFPANAAVPSRNTLWTRITDRYKDMILKLKDQLAHVSWICCTADCWKSRAGNRSYLGVTGHWLDDNLERVSAALAFKRFKGCHTFDRIADMLKDIFAIYDIPNDKIVFVVTDNGSNFVKAFKEFAAPDEIEEHESSEDENTEDMEFGYVIDSDDESQNQPVSPFLPNHARCASHTLNLIVSKDLFKLENDPSTEAGRFDFKKSPKVMIKSVFSKCQAFWNKLSRSSQIEEQVTDLTKKAILKPNNTRWNSLFDAVRRLLEFKTDLSKLFELEGVKPLNRTEIEFLEDYVTAVTPVSYALDKLQGEQALYFGSLAPVIFSVKTKLQECITNCNERKYVPSLASALKRGVENRFKNILDLSFESSPEAFLAAMSTPFFKLRWLPTDQRKLFQEEFVKEATKWSTGETSESDSSSAEIPEDCFFNFASADIKAVSNSDDVALECLRYFNDRSTDQASLSNYPTIRRMFHRFNTGLPSSAPVERLFSYAGLILRPNRAKMSDELFEKLVLLKINFRICFLR